MIGRKTKLEQTKEKITGVYMIKDKTEGKVYIGESFDIYRRWEQHKGDLINHRHDNYPLQRLYNEYGMGNLEFSIVHEVKNQPCDEITKLYLLYLEEEEISKIKNHSVMCCNIESKRNQFLKTTCHLKNDNILSSNKNHYERMYIYCTNKKIRVIDIRKVLTDFIVWEKKYIQKQEKEEQKKRNKQMILERCEKIVYDYHGKTITKQCYEELIKDIKIDVEKFKLVMNLYSVNGVDVDFRRDRVRFRSERKVLEELKLKKG